MQGQAPGELITLEQRGHDKFGSGAYGASRGSRTHHGIDYACEVGTLIFPERKGTVTKIGYPYGNDLSFRYVQVTDDEGFNHRYFYLSPMVFISDYVVKEQPIGSVQNLDKRYPGITTHCHYEIVKYLDGEKHYFDPNSFPHGAFPQAAGAS